MTFEEMRNSLGELSDDEANMLFSAMCRRCGYAVATLLDVEGVREDLAMRLEYLESSIDANAVTREQIQDAIEYAAQGDWSDHYSAMRDLALDVLIEKIAPKQDA